MTPFQGKLRIRHLEIMLVVAELGNLSKAAEQLDMTQSGLSRAIVDMEECVGGQLFERTPRGTKPTMLGRVLCTHANRLLGDFRKAQTDLAAVLRGDLGSLTVGCFSMFSGWPLPQAARRFRDQSPRVALSIEIGGAERLLEDLDAGALDMVVGRSPAGPNPQIYRTLALLNDPPVLACARQHVLAEQPSVALADCIAYPWVTALPGSRFRLELERRLADLGCEMPPMIGALSIEFGRELIANRDYVWMLPGSVAQVMQARGEVHVLPVALDLRESPLSIIWRRDRSSTRHVRAFAAILAQIVRETGPRGTWTKGGLESES
ncbi:MAG: LysR family transcriptional regulator [Pigmentiphaga sp.]|nr:LysR family transcriptional regulator [Pigmentiphaga sp.]